MWEAETPSRTDEEEVRQLVSDAIGTTNSLCLYLAECHDERVFKANTAWHALDELRREANEITKTDLP